MWPIHCVFCRRCKGYCHCCCVFAVVWPGLRNHRTSYILALLKLYIVVYYISIYIYLSIYYYSGISVYYCFLQLWGWAVEFCGAHRSIQRGCEAASRPLSSSLYEEHPISTPTPTPREGRGCAHHSARGTGECTRLPETGVWERTHLDWIVSACVRLMLCVLS